MKCFRSAGFNLVELLVVIAIIGILVGLLLPATRGAREAARRMQCANNFKQIGLGLHNYHSAYGHLPMAMGGTDRASNPLAGNANRLSGLVAILPFIEQQAVWEQISTPTEIDGVIFPPMGPAPWVSMYEPWQVEIPAFQCATAPRQDSEFGMTNYAFCLGDVARQIHNPDEARGMFACLTTTCFSDIADGLSNTIAMTEMGTPNDLSAIGQFAVGQPSSILKNPGSCRELLDPDRPGFYAGDVQLSELGRGGCWADGAAGYGLVNTILPPNSPNGAVGGFEAVDGIYSAGSFHQAGAHVLMGDGAVIFMTDSVESGDSSYPTWSGEGPAGSPYGLWGALGTASCQEEIEEKLIL